MDGARGWGGRDGEERAQRHRSTAQRGPDPCPPSPTASARRRRHCSGRRRHLPSNLPSPTPTPATHTTPYQRVLERVGGHKEPERHAHIHGGHHRKVKQRVAGQQREQVDRLAVGALGQQPGVELADVRLQRDAAQPAAAAGAHVCGAWCVVRGVVWCAWCGESRPDRRGTDGSSGSSSQGGRGGAHQP